MESKVKVELPLSSGNQTYQLPEPCTYCGQDVPPNSKLWELRTDYPLQRWVMSGSGTSSLSSGDESGKATVRAPYCRRHESTPLLQFWVVLFFSIVGGLLGFYLSSYLFRSMLESTLSSEWELWIARLGMLLTGGGLLVLFAWGSHKLLTILIPAWRDIPFGFSGAGNWGLQVEGVRADVGARGVGPVRYFLPLKFVNVASAKRCVAAYPNSQVVEGAGLLELATVEPH